MTESPDAERLDVSALHAKYLEERDKRLRSDGNRQYVSLRGEFSDYAVDPNADAGDAREPVVEDTEVLVVGGGIAGLVTCVELRRAGVTDFRVLEKGSSFGGVWYWNRYPGVRCDVESYIYLPLLEATGFVPSEKYATGREILGYLQHIGATFGITERALFQTKANALSWDEEAAVWTVSTDRGDVIRARFVTLACGAFTQPKLPGVPGIHTFRGHAFHTSRWDYRYTGGDASGGMTKLSDRTVAVIGTGASAVQCIPRLAESAARVLVFQRTPSAVDVRDNRATSEGWNTDPGPGWQRRRMVNFTSILSGVTQSSDLVADRWTLGLATAPALTDPAGNEALAPDAPPTDATQLADYVKMERIRHRIDEVVSSPAVARMLKPWYNFLCKRPLFSDEYLQAFNRPNVTLVDTDGRGVQRITEHAIEAKGESYDVDCIVFATGFDASAPVFEAGEFTVTGREGTDLAEKWRQGARSLHGMYTHGFPNLFIIGSRSQASSTINLPHLLGEQAHHVGTILVRALAERVETFEVSESAERQWAQIMEDKKVDRTDFERECTPGYFNNEGDTDKPTLYGSTYGGGPLEYIQVIEQWRERDGWPGVDVVRPTVVPTADRGGRTE
jgi:cyclohexanone monooxygenase